MLKVEYHGDDLYIGGRRVEKYWTPPSLRSRDITQESGEEGRAEEDEPFISLYKDLELTDSEDETNM